MALIKPFRALRFNKSKAGNPDSFCCPPYDIIPDPEPWLKRGEFNAIRLEGGQLLSESDPYRSAADTLREWKRGGVLRSDEVDSFYLYEVDFTADDGLRKTLSGIFAAAELRPWEDGVVLPHENTLSAAKTDRYNLMCATGCHFSPVYSLYEDETGEVDGLIASVKHQPPDDNFTMPDGTVHRLWVLSDPALCSELTAAFENKQLYIADGHHRYETSLKISREIPGASPYVMMFLASAQSSGLEIQATHRVVTKQDGFGGLRQKLEECFTLSPGNSPEPLKPVWVTKSGSYLLTPKSDPGDMLDVALLQDIILEPMLGIGSEVLAAGNRIIYTRSADEARELVDSGKAECAFLLAPTTAAQILSTARAGGKMPQKSTYFYPKIITGMVMYQFIENTGE